jgi:glutamate-1-semialdehyde 2,1-aminomutase
MDRLAPVGPVYQAGTLSGNPVATAAGLATLDLIDSQDPYAALESAAEVLSMGLHDLLEGANIGHAINREGSLFSLFFTRDDDPGLAVGDYESAKRADHDAYSRFFHAMLDAGVYLPPSGYEAWFVGAAHTPDVIARTLDAAKAAAATLRS